MSKRITLKIQPGSHDNDLAIAYLDKLARHKSKTVVSTLCKMLETNGITDISDLDDFDNHDLVKLKYIAKAKTEDNGRTISKLAEIDEKLDSIVMLITNKEPVVVQEDNSSKEIKEEYQIDEATMMALQEGFDFD